MTSREIRQQFLDFFKAKQHLIVPSAPMVLHNDPTLMFTNAGMNQFKDYFLGNAEPKSNRVTDTQKCLRVSGKHNDLEEVGIDTYHHTMFEMLGNWSFGDYFKKEAIAWGWELLTEVYKLPKERLYATVFGGDKADGLERDNEAFEYWKQYLPEDRILFCGKKDNFWEMGDVGPCGPCSEIHIDARDEKDIASKPGKDLVNADHPQVIEIWNLVFIQFERMADASLKNLPAKHVDTGMGFERLSMVMQGKTSSYDSDVFSPLIGHLEKKSGIKYGQNEKTDIAIRVIVDHIRAISFAIADGQLPSNNKAGYVIRRILRRAVRYGYTFLNFKEPFLYELVDVLSVQFEGIFPELNSQKDFISRVVKEEETNFLRTLDRGLKRIDAIQEELATSNKSEIDGKTAFELYDTYGFPLDLTALIARERNLTVDEPGFQAEMKIQKERSKSAAKVSTGDWDQIWSSDESQFVGYDEIECETLITKYREVSEKGKTRYHLVLGRTPFYAESGGQIGDTGVLLSTEESLEIIDTVKENDLTIHIADKLPSDVHQTFVAKVNKKKRLLTMNNHSATHLMHAALKQILGDHVQQKGSLVNEKILRFDFSHFAKMTDDEIKQVEKIVNQKIRENIVKGEDRNVPIEEAKKRGATALFGEKYGDFVRVITFDKDFSIELCGGTHVPATGNIGLFKIISEGSVAAGVRRIEAITADKAEAYFEKQEELLSAIKETLKNPADPIKAVESLVKEREELTKKIEAFEGQQVASIKELIKQSIVNLGGSNVAIAKADLPSSDALKKLGYDLRNETENLFLVVAANIKGKPQIAVMIDDKLVADRDLHAGKIVKELAAEIKGGGGGQPFFATAGGNDVNGLDKVVLKARELAQNMIAVSAD
ncbi:MAG: alanine--tRNA ligase [Cyclobacteriaceae bacterium]